tara:strand:- start:3439 stop:4542 length:1104 start_codon:yes stop_codon:yes gene_type:complete
MDNTAAIPDSTPRDDSVATGGQTEEKLLADIISNSQFVKNEESLPTEQVPKLDPEESDTQDPESEEAESEEVEEETNEEEVEATEEDAAEEVATQPEVFTTDDLDLDAKVSVKIDGKDTEVSFNDLIKGYSTEQSLSKKGRELGDQRKNLEEEYNKRLEEVRQLGSASAAILYSEEQALSKKYHDLEAQIDEARKENDTYKMGELKDEREQAQQAYWKARNQRESVVKNIQANNQKQIKENWDKQIKHFNDNINELIPDYNESTATSIREFAISEGMKPEVIDMITDPAIVKFVDDYRRLKQGVTKGTVKRKAVPAKRVPTRKTKSANEKKNQKAADLRTRALSANSSKSDQDAFLKTLAERSLSKV